MTDYRTRAKKFVEKHRATSDKAVVQALVTLLRSVIAADRESLARALDHRADVILSDRSAYDVQRARGETYRLVARQLRETK